MKNLLLKLLEVISFILYGGANLIGLFLLIGGAGYPILWLIYFGGMIGLPLLGYAIYKIFKAGKQNKPI